MKRMLPYLLAVPVLFFAGCTKGVLSPDRSIRGVDIIGSWYIAEVAQKNPGTTWNRINTGLEKGVFTFYGGGGARYEDGYNEMTGSWNIVTLSDGYYDSNGVFHRDMHEAFKLHLYDSYTNNSIDLYFDDIILTNGNIIGTSFSGHTVTRYIFERY